MKSFYSYVWLTSVLRSHSLYARLTNPYTKTHYNPTSFCAPSPQTWSSLQRPRRSRLTWTRATVATAVCTAVLIWPTMMILFQRWIPPSAVCGALNDSRRIAVVVLEKPDCHKTNIRFSKVRCCFRIILQSRKT